MLDTDDAEDMMIESGWIAVVIVHDGRPPATFIQPSRKTLMLLWPPLANTEAFSHASFGVAAYSLGQWSSVVRGHIILLCGKVQKRLQTLVE